MAYDYPIGMVYAESEIVVKRKNEELATQSILMQAAITSIWGDKGFRHWRELVDDLK